MLLAILAAAGHAPNFVLPLLAFITGLTLPVTFSGFTSMIPLIVAEEMLPSANSVEAASQNIALIGGPALAGLLAAAAGPPAALIGEVVLTLVALVLILRIPDLNRGATGRPEPMRTMIKRGLRHIVARAASCESSAVGRRRQQHRLGRADGRVPALGRRGPRVEGERQRRALGGVRVRLADRRARRSRVCRRGTPQERVAFGGDVRDGRRHAHVAARRLAAGRARARGR